MPINLNRHKLVRDNIPKIIKAEGQEIKSYVLSKKQYELALLNKVIEESMELASTTNRSELLEELSDTYEVLDAICAHHGITLNELTRERIEKVQKKGAFRSRIAIPIA